MLVFISDAQKLLGVLQNFEREVEDAKQRAQDAVSELDDLEDRLDAAESKVGTVIFDIHCSFYFNNMFINCQLNFN